MTQPGCGDGRPRSFGARPSGRHARKKPAAPEPSTRSAAVVRMARRKRYRKYSSLKSSTIWSEVSLSAIGNLVV